jgi:hypothetical protein
MSLKTYGNTMGTFFLFKIKILNPSPYSPYFFIISLGQYLLPKRVGTYLDSTSFSLRFIKKEEAISPTHERVILQILYNPQNWGPHV